MEKQELINAFDEYNVLIYRYIFVRVNRSKEVAEDLAQEVFLKAWIHKNNFDKNRATIKTWLFVIAKNLIIDHYRKGKNIDSISDEILETTVESKSDLEKDLTFDYLVKQMDKLSELDRELLTLRYVSELDIEEISKVVNKEYGTTKVAIHRALNKLKEIVNG